MSAVIEATPYSVLMSRVESTPGEARVSVPEDWLQGRTLFGGLQSAIALKAMRSLGIEAPLRSLQTIFVGPVGGGMVQARARVLRSGKNTTHVEARIVEGDQTLCLVVGVFGVARDSAINVPMRQPAVTPRRVVDLMMPPAELVRDARNIGVQARQHFRLRLGAL